MYPFLTYFLQFRLRYIIVRRRFFTEPSGVEEGFFLEVTGFGAIFNHDHLL